MFKEVAGSSLSVAFITCLSSASPSVLYLTLHTIYAPSRARWGWTWGSKLNILIHIIGPIPYSLGFWKIGNLTYHMLKFRDNQSDEKAYHVSSLSLNVKLVRHWWKQRTRRLSYLTTEINFHQPMVSLGSNHWEINVQIVTFTNADRRMQEKHLHAKVREKCWNRIRLMGKSNKDARYQDWRKLQTSMSKNHSQAL